MSSPEIVIYSSEVRSLGVRALTQLGEVTGPQVWRIPVEMARLLVAEQPVLLRQIDSGLADLALSLRDRPDSELPVQWLEHASSRLTPILWGASRSTRSRGRSEVSLKDVAIALEELLDPDIEVEAMVKDGEGGIDVIDTIDVCWGIVGEAKRGFDSGRTASS